MFLFLHMVATIGINNSLGEPLVHSSQSPAVVPVDSSAARMPFPAATIL